jgi:hypothetical protein
MAVVLYRETAEKPKSDAGGRRCRKPKGVPAARKYRKSRIDPGCAEP